MLSNHVLKFKIIFNMFNNNIKIVKKIKILIYLQFRKKKMSTLNKTQIKLKSRHKTKKKTPKFNKIKLFRNIFFINQFFGARILCDAHVQTRCT